MESFKHTADEPKEAAQLAAQIANLILGKITSHFVFKFSCDPSSNPGQEVAKNGLHWAELYNDPFPISDTTLEAEHFRLLTKMINATIFVVNTNDTASKSSYLSSKSNDGFYYLFAVNYQNRPIALALNVSGFSPLSGTQIIAEAAGPGYWGKILGLFVTPLPGSTFNVILNAYTTLRLAMPIGLQSILTINATLSCTSQAGINSNQTNCFSKFILSGTSNTINHERTSVALLKFDLNNYVYTSNQKVLLSVNVESIVNESSNVSSVTLVVLGFTGSAIFDSSFNSSWDFLSNSKVDFKK